MARPTQSQDPLSRSRWLGPALPEPARRIVSLVPSLTEALFQIGAGPRLLARTEFCVRPSGQVGGIETIGGTKNPDRRRIRDLAPDVILSAKEENTKRAIEDLAKDFPIWLTDPQAPSHVPDLWRELGRLTGLVGEGDRLALETQAALSHASRLRESRQGRGPSFAYYIWKAPAMVAGHGTYISNLLESVGFRNGLDASMVRFPRLDDDPGRLEVDAHFFSSEPYLFQLPRDLDLLASSGPWKEEGVGFRNPQGSVARLVDAERLSWYPSLTVEGLRYAASLLADSGSFR